jgi:benzoyl-CoA reductase/2-hydroxyglutaryl-CoA dehydratase subunit BcrC/BadD/HgdB
MSARRSWTSLASDDRAGTFAMLSLDADPGKTSGWPPVMEGKGAQSAPRVGVTDVASSPQGASELQTMAGASFDPLGQAAQHVREQRSVVGIIGFDVPHELVVAAGMVPVRLRADPTVDRQAYGDLSAMALDPIATSHVVRFLRGDYGCFEHLIISHDRGLDAKLFFVLRELSRLGELPARPDFAFLDLRHLPNETTAEYNRVRIGELEALLATWAGRPISRGDVLEAVTVCNANRQLLKRFQTLRTGGPPRFSGVEALAVIGAAMAMDKWEFQAAVTRLLDQAEDRPGVGGPRLLASGSTPEDAELYRAIETAGALVVGEDHDFGDRSFEQLVTETADPLDGITRAYGSGAPAASWGGIGARAAFTVRCARRSRAEAVLNVLFDHDGSLGWDRPATRKALSEAGLPLIEAETPWGASNTENVERMVRAFAAGERRLS